MLRLHWNSSHCCFSPPHMSCSDPVKSLRLESHTGTWIFIPPESFSSLVLLQQCSCRFFLPSHLPGPWASSAPPPRFPPHSQGTLYNWIIIFQLSPEQLVQKSDNFWVSDHWSSQEWHLKENPPLSLLHLWTELDWVLLIPASLLLLHCRNKLQRGNQGCCALQMHHLTPVLWRWVYTIELQLLFLLIKLMWDTNKYGLNLGNVDT